MAALKEVLQKDLGHDIIEVTDPEAKLAGSDVLFTGKLLKYFSLYSFLFLLF